MKERVTGFGKQTQGVYSRVVGKCTRGPGWYIHVLYTLIDCKRQGEWKGDWCDRENGAMRGRGSRACEPDSNTSPRAKRSACMHRQASEAFHFWGQRARGSTCAAGIVRACQSVPVGAVALGFCRPSGSFRSHGCGGVGRWRRVAGCDRCRGWRRQQVWGQQQQWATNGVWDSAPQQAVQGFGPLTGKRRLGDA